MVVEPYYMEGTTPDQLTAFVSEPKYQRRCILSLL